MASDIDKVFVGSVIHFSSASKCDMIEKAILGVKKDGRVAFLDKGSRLNSYKQSHSFENFQVIHLTNSQFLIPGLIDTHINACQPIFAGTGYNTTLSDWNNELAFPTEKIFKNLSYSKTQFTKLVKNTLKSGTTTAVYTAPIYLQPALLLGSIAEKSGQSAFIGKSCMDVNVSYPSYKEHFGESIKHNKTFMETIKAKKNDRIHPFVVIRNVASCTTDLISGLASIASFTKSIIQCSVSESVEDNRLAKELFPMFANCCEIYHNYGLITTQTLLVHCNHLSEREINLVKQADATVVHCPHSCFIRRSGLLNARDLIDSDINVCLGTDSGNSSSSMLHTMKRALDVSQAFGINEDTKLKSSKKLKYRSLDVLDVFQMATLNAAKALGIHETVGNFEIGKFFDAILVDLDTETSNVQIFENEDLKSMFEKFIIAGDEQNIKDVFVSGKVVYNHQKHWIF